MKLIVFIMLLISVNAVSQTSIYDLEFKNAYGAPMSMGNYKGQKILIASVSVENLRKKSSEVFWDSLKAVHPNLVIILIPANDIGPASDSVDMENLKKDNNARNASGSIIITGKSDVKKDKGNSQTAIMQWLTDVNKNRRYDGEVESDQQIYVVSESGELYAILAKGIGMVVLDEVISQEDVKPSVFAQ